jgi:hypothetical protein
MNMNEMVVSLTKPQINQRVSAKTAAVIIIIIILSEAQEANGVAPSDPK